MSPAASAAGRGTVVVLLRHAHTADNEAGAHVRMSGWTDVPLSARGEAQARALAERLAAGPPAAALFASPLRRARDTAAALTARLGLPVQPCADLREIGCGEADGLPVSEVRTRFPDAWRRHQLQQDADARWPGGESYAELRARALRAMRAIADRHPGQRVLVVTHAGVISQLLGWIHGLPAGRWAEWRPDNASLTEVAWSEGRARLLRFGG